MNTFRTESDSLGKIKISKHAYWGAQTQRSLENFTIGGEHMPHELIMAIIFIKKAAAMVNLKFKKLTKKKSAAICKVADELLSGNYLEQFPLVVWQTGSGTQTNMNVNEVIANRAIELLGGNIGTKFPIHPNDDVNCSQSTNDVFPSAIHIAVVMQIEVKLLPALRALSKALREKSKNFQHIIKVGRTHLMDAAPITLGQEFSGYTAQIDAAIQQILSILPQLHVLALGATAVGTGLNSPKNFDKEITKVISQLTGFTFKPAKNKFKAIASHDSIVAISGALKRLSCGLFKIANDIRLMASGPRAGLGELILPENEPGSSIMPGKINPTQCEALAMIAIQVMGYDAAIGFAGALGNFELNTYQPLLGYNILRSIHLLSDSIESFTTKCIIGITANQKQIADKLHHSLMLATVLTPTLGYDTVAHIVRTAHAENLSLKAATIGLGHLTEEQFDEIVNIEKMIRP